MIGNKEEGFVPLDWAAKQAAENIAVKHRPLDARGFQKWVISVERRVAEVFIGRSMKVIGAALRDSLNVAAGGPAKRGVIK